MADTDIKLKPCPFCGSKGAIEHKKALGTWIVQCSNGTCFCSFMIGWDYETEAEAVDAWNHREEEQVSLENPTASRWGKFYKTEPTKVRYDDNGQ